MFLCFELSVVLNSLTLLVQHHRALQSEQENQQTMPINLKLTFPLIIFPPLLEEAVPIFVLYYIGVVPCVSLSREGTTDLSLLTASLAWGLCVSESLVSICLRAPKCHWSHLLEQRTSITQKVALSEARRYRPPLFHRLIPS